MWNPFKKKSWTKVNIALAFLSGAAASDAKPEHIKEATKHYYNKWYNDQGTIPNKLDKN